MAAGRVVMYHFQNGIHLQRLGLAQQLSRLELRTQGSYGRSRQILDFSEQMLQLIGFELAPQHWLNHPFQKGPGDLRSPDRAPG